MNFTIITLCNRELRIISGLTNTNMELSFFSIYIKYAAFKIILFLILVVTVHNYLILPDVHNE